jgi:hypothetical protein
MRPFAMLAGMLATLVLLAVFARADEQCFAGNENHARFIAGRMNATEAPRRVESGAAARSLNELIRAITDDDREHSFMWWAPLNEGGLLIVGSEGGGCGVMQVPPAQWLHVQRVIHGVAI